MGCIRYTLCTNHAYIHVHTCMYARIRHVSFALSLPASGMCGDGERAGDEGCDDGNSVSGDGCSATCTVECGFTCMGDTPTSGDVCRIENILVQYVLSLRVHTIHSACIQHTTANKFHHSIQIIDYAHFISTSDLSSCPFYPPSLFHPPHLVPGFLRRLPAVFLAKRHRTNEPLPLCAKYHQDDPPTQSSNLRILPERDYLERSDRKFHELRIVALVQLQHDSVCC